MYCIYLTNSPFVLVVSYPIALLLPSMCTICLGSWQTRGHSTLVHLYVSLSLPNSPFVLDLSYPIALCTTRCTICLGSWQTRGNSTLIQWSAIYSRASRVSRALDENR